MRYFTFFFSCQCGITQPMLAGCFYKRKPLHLYAKTFRHRKSFILSGGPAPRLTKAVGIIHRRTLSISRFGLQEFPDATASPPTLNSTSLRTSFLLNSILLQINSRYFCASDGEPAVANYVGTDGIASRFSFYTQKSKCISQRLQV